MSKNQGPKVLLLDIETAPMIAHVWRLWGDNSIGLNQIQKDWHLLSWSAKWLEPGPYAKNDKKVMYMDQRYKKDISDDKDLAKGIWKLLDEADIIITQNGKRFDAKKLNAKFIEHNLHPPSTYRHIDTCELAKKHFDFPSNRLEYMTEKFNKRYKKLKHKKFPGHELWTECMKGNRAAWNEMAVYNKHDVLSLEELYHRFAPWSTIINWSVYHDNEENVCQCGSKAFKANGHDYTKTGKFQRFKCKRCGQELKSRKNVLSKSKRDSLWTTSNRTP